MVGCHWFWRGYFGLLWHEHRRFGNFFWHYYMIMITVTIIALVLVYKSFYNTVCIYSHANNVSCWIESKIASVILYNGPFPLWDALAGNHGSCSHNLGLGLCFDKYNYHDSLQAHFKWANRPLLVADFCVRHRCLNGASCVNGDLNYTCLYNTGRTGTYCDLSMDGKHAYLSICCEQFK